MLEAPLPVPRQIRDFSVFPGHIRQAPVGMRKLQARMAGQPIPDLQAADSVPELYRSQPIYYLSNRFSVAGPDATVMWPGYSRFMDFELELAAVIGRAGKNIGVAEAAGHIFGYTIYNDFSARDAQLIEMQGFLGPAKGKSFDGGNAHRPVDRHAGRDRRSRQPRDARAGERRAVVARQYGRHAPQLRRT